MEILHALKVFYLRKNEPVIVDEVSSEDLDKVTSKGSFSVQKGQVDLKGERFSSKTGELKLNDTQTLSFKALEDLMKKKYIQIVASGEYEDMVINVIKTSEPGKTKAQFIVTFYMDGKYLSYFSLEKDISEGPDQVLNIFQDRLKEFGLDTRDDKEMGPVEFSKIIRYMADAESSGGAREMLNGRRILLVDPDYRSRQLSRKVLKYAGAKEIVDVRGAKECLDLLLSLSGDRFDLVLTDIYVSDTDGLVLKRKINTLFPRRKVMIWYKSIMFKKGDESQNEGGFTVYNKDLPFYRLMGIIKSRMDAALIASNGGIDFNRSHMQMNVRREGQGVQLQFDPALIARIRREGFDGLDFKIQSIVPVTDLRLLLGLK